jgi:hypothetical protein
VVRTLLAATSRATSSSPARAATAPSSRPRIAGRTPVALDHRDRAHDRGHRPRRSGCSTTAFGTTLGGTPATIITLFGDTPRALAVSPDDSTVYAAIFESGNRTTTINEARPERR